jgi:hypothetical protein
LHPAKQGVHGRLAVDGHFHPRQAEKELAEFYPKDPDGATPIAYLWAQTIRCEDAGRGGEWLKAFAAQTPGLLRRAAELDYRFVSGQRPPANKRATSPRRWNGRASSARRT